MLALLAWILKSTKVSFSKILNIILLGHLFFIPSFLVSLFLSVIPMEGNIKGFFIFPVFILIENYDVGYMDIYFYVSLIVLIFFLSLLWKSTSKLHYLRLHNLLKFVVVSGVFSIVLINPEVLFHGRNYLKL